MGSSASTLAATYDEKTIEIIKKEYETQKEIIKDEAALDAHMKSFVSKLEPKPIVEGGLSETSDADIKVASATDVNIEELILALPEAIRSVRTAKLHKKPSSALKQVCDTISGVVESEILSKYYQNVQDEVKKVMFHEVQGENDEVVSSVTNFDKLCYPADHITRRGTDCYYLKPYEATAGVDIPMMRTHMAAHIPEMISKSMQKTGERCCTVTTGDVYRKVEEDEFNSEYSHELLLCILQPIANADDTEKELLIKDMKDLTLKIVLQSMLKKEDTSLTPPKSRWEEFDDEPFIQPDTHQELQLLYLNEPIPTAYCGVFASDFLKTLKVGLDQEQQSLEEMEGYFVSICVDRLAMMMHGKENIKQIQSLEITA